MPVKNRAHLVECDHRISLAIPAQTTVRAVDVMLVAGSLDDTVMKAWDPRRFVLRSCEITPVR